MHLASFTFSAKDWPYRWSSPWTSGLVQVKTSTGFVNTAGIPLSHKQQLFSPLSMKSICWVTTWKCMTMLGCKNTLASHSSWRSVRSSSWSSVRSSLTVCKSSLTETHWQTSQWEMYELKFLPTAERSCHATFLCSKRHFFPHCVVAVWSRL